MEFIFVGSYQNFNAFCKFYKGFTVAEVIKELRAGV